jgi:tetratricopeptide (TPR) repeat protein
MEADMARVLEEEINSLHAGVCAGLADPKRIMILYQLADRYYRMGRWPLAAETFQRLAERFPEHPLAPLAMRWLVQYHAGEEAAWRTDRDKSQHEKRYQQALTLGKEIERTRPEWFAEPAFRLPLAAACRNLGQPRQAERFYMLQSRGPERDAWWACAQAELRLADPKSRPAKAMLSCVRAEQKPRLDGKLDDPVWQLA